MWKRTHRQYIRLASGSVNIWKTNENNLSIVRREFTCETWQSSIAMFHFPTVITLFTYLVVHTQFNSVQLNSTQFSSIQSNSTQFNSIPFNSIQLNSDIFILHWNIFQMNSPVLSVLKKLPHRSTVSAASPNIHRGPTHDSLCFNPLKPHSSQIRRLQNFMDHLSEKKRQKL